MASATPRRAPRAAPRRPPLRAVRPTERVRSVGTIGTLVAGFFFVILLSLAGLHAVVVQTQANLDSVKADVADLEDDRVNSIAERAWYDSPAGLADAAAAAGLVPAADFVMLVPVPPDLLGGPSSADPFATAGGEAG